MSFNRIELGEVVEFLDNQRVPIAEAERKPGLYPYYGANGQQGWIDGYLFNEPLVLLAEDGGNFGSKERPIAYKVVGKCWVNNHAHVLRPKPTIDIDYLKHVLSFCDVSPFVSGTTRLKLTKGNAENIPIPFPSLPEQKRIAAILEKADRLHRLRRTALQLSDGFLQSVFLEMFGDPATNPKGWEVVELGMISDVASGVTKGQDYRGKATVEVPYLRVANVQAGYLDLTEIRTIQALPSDVEALRLEPGDVLMTEGGDFDKLGRGAVWRGEIANCIHQNHIFRVRLDQQVAIPEYFGHFLQTEHIKDHFVRASKQTTNLATINMTQLRETPVLLPNINLQGCFAEIVRRHERLHAQQREALRQAEHLFQTLLHRAFTGELARESNANRLRA